ncbi:metalloregulator ArsR/SmtB family transcription factor [Desulfobotulus sp. H1]|uniref:Metalloregulator ArsR/SmtB family transcription factor n=1 Tax=Desulfobotulus pelophilus TaxID=2823377 RepID=A0ABT3N8S2_9BACT|nr:metalloregulator ArsR/SmtB family transcription factor [Desulfobotulus pelophilus]MCW7753850.1 metalloregulator ArsR/SmtB family transcription factor [Desulfobotulus pelophilus]
MDILIFSKALSDPTRIRLIHILDHHELSVNEIVAVMGMGQSRISRHLKILTDAGLLSCRRDGVWAFYGVPAEGSGRDFVVSVREWMRKEPELAADRVRAAEVLEARRRSTSRFFDTIATDWDALRREILGDFDLNACLLSAAGRPRLAVDLGCGTGELLQGLARQAGSVIGVDYSMEMLAEAERRFRAAGLHADLRLGAIEHLPVADGVADLAIISLALHHLPDPEGGIRDAARILVPGGVLLLADFDKHDKEFLRERFGDRWLGFQQETIARFLEGAGFDLTKLDSFSLPSSLSLSLYHAVRRA